MAKRNIFNPNIDNYIDPWKNSENQVFSGPGIEAVIYMPLLTLGNAVGKDKPKVVKLGNLQTISISSTRSISPVRVFGQSNAIAYTKGAITFAGTMVFATINQGAFTDIYDIDLAESYVNGSTNALVHYLPPFSIVLTVTNESGAAGIQVINNITITNSGAVYSIDDLYLEEQYTYVATNISPFIPIPMSQVNLENYLNSAAEGISRFGKNVSNVIEENLGAAYGKTIDFFKKYEEWYSYKTFTKYK